MSEKLCECGCGKEVIKETNRFIVGHNSRILSKEKIICKICGKECSSCCGLSKHIVPIHKISLQSYYDQFIRLSLNEGKCYCGKDTKFGNIRYGYFKYCSTVCAGNNSDVQEKKIQTNQKNCGEDHWAKSSKGKTYHRIQSIKQRELQRENHEPDMPCIGSIERSCLNILESYVPNKIIRNNHDYSYKVGRYPDGEIIGLPLFIQYNEKFHYIDKNEMMKIENKETIQTTLDLASVGYLVFNISEYNWINNQEKVISDFKLLISLLQEIISI
jgi:hypothetical protein